MRLRRAANRALTQPGVWETLQTAFPELATIPHRDTVARVIEAIPPETFETVIVKTIHRLLKNGQLRHWMVLNHYLVAVDGAVKWGAPYPWAEEALKKETKAGTWYQAYVVEVVLVCPGGGGHVAAFGRILYESGRRRPGDPTGFGTQSVLSGGETPPRRVSALASRLALRRPLP
ncbi:MAG: transposase family protein [Firmicutes bacterium]|nr:transposase family protein [Bacillota bacterium]